MYWLYIYGDVIVKIIKVVIRIHIGDPDVIIRFHNNTYHVPLSLQQKFQQHVPIAVPNASVLWHMCKHLVLSDIGNANVSQLK